jgi:hypothetical protein
MCCPPARKFGFVLESVSLNLMLERTRLNYARVMIVPKSGSLVLGSRAVKSCRATAPNVMFQAMGASPIAAVALDRLPSRSVYWYFVRCDGMPSWSGIAARIWEQ